MRRTAFVFFFFLAFSPIRHCCFRFISFHLAFLSFFFFAFLLSFRFSHKSNDGKSLVHKGKEKESQKKFWFFFLGSASLLGKKGFGKGEKQFVSRSDTLSF